MPQRYIDFAFVKEQAAFEPVLAHYNLYLTGRGTQRAVLCPFHRERKASCKVELDRKIFHCFGCGAHGNILEFVAGLEGNDDDLRAAALKIAEICGIDPAPPRERPLAPAPKPQQKRKAPRRRKAEPEKEAPAAPAASDEPINPPLTFELKLDAAHPYLTERGLSKATIAEFGLGFCNRGLMAGRVCIPIHDAAGQLIAYAGRWPGEPPEGEERYKLPAKFEKRRVLYNLNRIGEDERVVLVEGYFAAIKLHTLGIPVVALMGTSVSPEQIALLKSRGIRFVTLLLDGDDAGRQARERALPELSASLFVSAPLLPDGEKPDTLDESDLRQLICFPSA